jgi:hypothetical protein
MFQLKTILNIYWTKIKYALSVILFIAWIFAIRTYVNYWTVVDSIETVDARTAAVQNEMDYAQNFQKKYLASDYGYLFLAHDNSMVFRWEEIILFKSSWDVVETWFNTDLTHIPYRPTEEEQKKMMDPMRAWNLYLSETLSKIK